MQSVSAAASLVESLKSNFRNEESSASVAIRMGLFFFLS